MVLAGAGVDHGELVRLAEKFFGGLQTGGAGGSSKAARDLPSIYSGGEARNIVSADKVKRKKCSVSAVKNIIGRCLNARVPLFVRRFLFSAQPLFFVIFFFAFFLTLQ